jgi:phosphotriesterase-related protein
MANSVLGNIEPGDLGFTLMHEHIATINPSMNQTFKNWFNREETISNAVEQLKHAKKLGLKTIVDATPINLGRDIRIIREVAEKADVQIIASTGLYHVDEPFLMGWEIENLVDLLMPEIEIGIQGTEIKPGAIKCASETSITETNKKLLKMAAKLHENSGLPVITHSSCISQNGIEQQAILLDEGVDPNKLVIGHCGDTTDIDYLESILTNGSYIGLDRFGIDMLLSMDSRVDVCVELCEKGYEEQIVVSHDYNVYIDWFPKETYPYFKEANLPMWSFHHLLVDIIPRLLEKGVSNKQVEKITVGNPMKILH